MKNGLYGFSRRKRTNKYIKSLKCLVAPGIIDFKKYVFFFNFLYYVHNIESFAYVINKIHYYKILCFMPEHVVFI